LKSGYISKKINKEAIINYFNYLYIPSPKTAFTNVQKLEAGHYLKISNAGIKKNKWYELNKFIEPSSNNYKDLKCEIRDLLEDSIKLQMRSDMSVGAFLSGGIDSSLITAIASKSTNIPINTFSVGFTPTEFNELPYAKKVSELYKTKHHELIVSSEDAIQELRKIMWYMDEPIGDSAVLPSYLVSKLAVSQVKVALSGLGGDELFGGYNRYKPFKSKMERLSFVPKVVFKAIKPIMKNVVAGYEKQIDHLYSTNSEKYHKQVAQMSSEMIYKLTGDMHNKEFYGKDLKRIFSSYQGIDKINQRMFTDIQLYMNDQLLHLTDRVSMANSLETRVPFLDHRLVELSLSIPSKYKINLNDTKIILKDSIKDLLPAEILYRPKWGFAAPYKTWTLTNAMKDLIQQTIEGDLVSDGILDKNGVEDFLGNKEMIELYSTWVWPIIALELWYTNYKNI
jgi:asparagine synthase (glutamine-hydrolysing)